MSKMQTPALVVTCLFILMIVGGLIGAPWLIAPWVFLSPFACMWLGRRSSGVQVQLVSVQETYVRKVIEDAR